MSEYSPEISSGDIYNNLLIDARELHFNAAVNDVYGQLTVKEHTDSRTNMIAGDPWCAVLHFTTDITPAGVLLRRVFSTRDEDQRHVQSDMVLLSTHDESKKIRTSEYIMEKRLPLARKDTDNIITLLHKNGDPLDAATMEIWGSSLRLLRTEKTAQSPTKERSRRVGSMVRRITGS